MMKRMFARNILTRKIMTLHSNTQDLLFVCRTVYESGKANGVEAPVYYESYEAALKKASRSEPDHRAAELAETGEKET